MSDLDLAVIGTGYWGPNLVRNFHDLGCLKIICDKDSQKLNKLEKDYPKKEYVEDYRKVLDRGDIDAVCLATPAATHADFTQECLKADKHVYVEKPLAYETQRAKKLCDLADKRNKTLMVGHILLYHPAVQYLFKLVQNNELGDINYSYSTRVNLGLVRMDANVLWNLAVHDLAIILELYDSEPVSVTASGQDFVQDGLEDVSFMTVHFENGELAHFHASWMDPQKVRRLTVVGDEKMAIFDDMKPSDKLAIHEKGVELSENGRSDDPSEVNCEPEIFKGSTVLPSISGEEPLYKECKHFLECIRDEKNPLTDGKHALKVIRVLEAADRSQKNNGKAIEIRKEGITSET